MLRILKENTENQIHQKDNTVFKVSVILLFIWDANVYVFPTYLRLSNLPMSFLPTYVFPTYLRLSYLPTSFLPKPTSFIPTYVFPTYLRFS